MTGRNRALSLVAGAAFLAGTSCTHDFDSFEGGAAAGRSGSPADGGGAGVDANAGGLPQGGTDGGGTPGSGGAGGGGSPGGTGGVAKDGGGAGGAATGGGAGTDGGGGAAGDSGAGTGGGGGNCSSLQKLCGSGCVNLDDPATGCAATSCTACSFPNAAAICSVGACAQGACSAGFGDCDTSAAAPGCERPVHDDVANCGGCNRACSTTHVTKAVCTANACTSFCAPGFGNCSKPTSGIDNGCETPVTTDSLNCGGCGNNCTLQRSKSCVAGKCVCDSARDCNPGAGNPPSTMVCDPSGVCSCSTVLCVPGETCTSNGAACSCNGDAACGAGQTCCQTPKGCFDLQTDSANCGGCGHPCAPGLSCVAGVCQ